MTSKSNTLGGSITVRRMSNIFVVYIYKKIYITKRKGNIYTYYTISNLNATISSTRSQVESPHTVCLQSKKTHTRRNRAW